MGRTGFCILTDGERGRIIEEALAILADTGVEVSGKGIREGFARAGRGDIGDARTGRPGGASGSATTRGGEDRSEAQKAVSALPGVEV